MGLNSLMFAMKKINLMALKEGRLTKNTQKSKRTWPCIKLVSGGARESQS